MSVDSSSLSKIRRFSGMKEKAWLFNRNADFERTDKDILLLECVHSLFFSPLRNSVRKQGHISIINGIGKEGKGLE